MKRCRWLARHGDELFLEDHALVVTQDGGPGIAARNAIANGGRNMRDFVAVRLALIIFATEPFECL